MVGGAAGAVQAALELVGLVRMQGAAPLAPVAVLRAEGGALAGTLGSAGGVAGGEVRAGNKERKRVDNNKARVPVGVDPRRTALCSAPPTRGLFAHFTYAAPHRCSDHGEGDLLG